MKIRLIILILFFNHSFLEAQQSDQNSDIVKTTRSPFSLLKSINLTDVTWTDGFWKERVDLVREVTIPHLYEVMNNEDQGKSVHNLEIAAGLKEGEYTGNNWQDAWLYKWIEMAVVSYAVTQDRFLDENIDELISKIAIAQESDGYISTNIQVQGIERFMAPRYHEWYNMGHLLTAAALHHRITGKSNFLTVANKVCDYGYTMFKDHNEEMAHFPINPSIIMGAVEMYRETNNPRHLELAGMVIDTRGKYPDGTDNWQDRIPLREEKEVMGQSVWYTYLYAGAADVYMETGDSTLLFALEHLWKDLVDNKLYIHGGVSALYRGYGIRKDGEIWKAQEVYESVGLPYQQPNAYGYNETCGQIGNFMWNYRMLNISGEAKFAELMENEMYNGFLGSMGMEGKSFFYVNPLRWHGKEQIMMSQSELQRGIPGSANIGTCCPTNYARTLAELQGMFYSKSDNAFWIHHYGANSYNDGEVILEQKTEFPWDGKIEFDIQKFPDLNTLMIRIPEWASGTKVSVNGSYFKKIEEGMYLEISGLNKRDNKITIEFPLIARIIVGNPKIEETRNQVAVKRGPVLYTLEEIDLPEEVNISSVVIPSDIQFEANIDTGFYQEIPVLKGRAKYFQQPDWDHVMYQEFENPDFKEFTLKMIPYFTWANRGISKMSVWLPIDY